MILAIIASLVAAALNASSSVLERISTQRIKNHRLLAGRQALANFLNRLFLIGMGLQIAGFFMQALALARAPLIVVAPLLTTDLLFLLLLIHFPLKVKVRGRDWRAAIWMMVGMSGLFLAASPVGGHLKYALDPWLLTIIIAVFLVTIALVIVRTVNQASRRAAAAAFAAAVSFALNAAFTKLALNQFRVGGVATVISSWPLYALIISGIVSIYLMQTAYATGPLAVSQPIMEVAEPTLSVIIGMAIFGDSVNHTAGALTIQVMSLAAVVWGIVRLSTSPQIHKAGERGV